MPRKIDALARDMAQTHARWGNDQIKSLVHAAQDGPGITRREEAKLKDVLSRYADRIEPQALSAFRSFLDTDIAALED